MCGFDAINVTPFVGVWIETSFALRCKHKQSVTPFVGVWIETCCSYGNYCRYMSHPSWVCGLKRFFKDYKIMTNKESHPSWVCGLKLCFHNF